MCYGCWEQKGSPIIDTPAVRAAAETVARVYDFSVVGGAMHIFTDDWNVEDDHLDFCEAHIGHESVWDREHHRWSGTLKPNNDPPKQQAAERACVNAFRPLSLDERRSALALADGFWDLAPCD